MLVRALFILCLIFVSGFALSQENTSPYSSKCLTSGNHTEVVSLSSTENCIGGSTKLYFHIYIQEGGATSVNIGATSGWSVSSGTFTFKVYGPFIDLATGHTQVAGGYAPTVAISASPTTPQTMTVSSGLEEGRVYIIEITLDCSTTLSMNSISTKISWCKPPSLITDYCDNCITRFQPTEGKYVFSAWTKEEGALVTKTSYTYPSIEVKTDDGVTINTVVFTPSGDIIDGWQQITGTFDVPANMELLEISFEVGGSGESALFDDVRIFPFDGSMMSYVYDPVTLRLVAELDERNYAKLYEYDEEGKLVRVKKETEKGILTIMENRENSVKKP